MAGRRRRYWMGIDGEGIGRNPHRYVLLAASDADGISSYVENYKRGLTSEECFDFFLSLPEMARVAGYYLGYDWTMILADLPDRSIYRLLRPELRILPSDDGGGFSPVHWRGYKLHFLSGSMSIRRGKEQVTVWDLGKYYQAPFVDSLKAWNIDVDVGMVADMKGRRSEFTAKEKKTIRIYCLAECRGLAKLATHLEEAHEGIGLRPSVWHGPGSTAGCALKQLGIKDKRGEELIPKGAIAAVDCAFFGGRFEHRLLGTVDHVWGRDIASAYPYQAYQLPCLEHARWSHTKKEAKLDAATHAVVRFRIRDVGRVCWGPLPIRLGDGTIVYPRSGASGWVWLDEWRAARAGWEGLEFVEAWTLKTECVCRPFAQVRDWYEERLKLGKSGRGRILKLVLNSIYGKLAQTIGRPQYASRAWAGMITSGTRAQLLRAMCAHSSLESVIACATDGIYATEEAPLEESKLYPLSLGSWESENHGRMTFVRPGIYWSHDDETLRARGMGRRKLDEQRATVLDAIARKQLGRVSLGTSTLFGGARACVYRLRDGRYRRSRFYGQWHDAPARISLDPAPKRQGDWSLRRLPGIESAPYSKTGTSDEGEMLGKLADLLYAMR